MSDPRFDVKITKVNDTEAVVDLHVTEWNKTVARLLEKACDELIKNAMELGVNTIYAVGSEHPKFCLYMGGEYVGSHVIDDKEYEVFKWALR